jgi:hypothetical protein
MLTLKIFRKIADPDFYRAVAHDGPRPLAPGVLNTFPVSVPVQAGDVLGLNAADSSHGTACRFGAPFESGLRDRIGNLADGDQGAFSADLGDRINVSAVVSPTNTFTLGAITRNKKKGTATLTATVPNPGELFGSGKGVKVASAAVTSKTVTAPGEVKLTIRAKGKKKGTLNETGKVKVKPKITYTPTGATPVRSRSR